jgi:hypothetical protein
MCCESFAESKDGRVNGFDVVLVIVPHQVPLGSGFRYIGLEFLKCDTDISTDTTPSVLRVG